MRLVPIACCLLCVALWALWTQCIVGKSRLRQALPEGIGNRASSSVTIRSNNKNIPQAADAHLLPLHHSQFQPTAAWIQQRIQELQAKFPSCRDKASYLQFILGAHSNNNDDSSADELISSHTCDALPTEQQISRQYGADPIIIGMDTCQAYRDRLDILARTSTTSLQQHQVPGVPKPRIAGMYHCATNFLALLLQTNLRHVDYIRAKNPLSGYNVPWGKHLRPLPYRETNLSPSDRLPEDVDAILPIVVIRDPYYWMQAMCKAPYDVRWHKLANKRCPNLWNEDNLTAYPANARTHQTDFQKIDYYDSLIDVWNQFFREYYYNATFPRLIVRYEDVVSRPERVVGAIRECIDMEPSKRPFVYPMQPAKTHGNPAGFAESMQHLATSQGRHRGMNKLDRVYAASVLDQELMQLFHYQYAPLRVAPSDMQEPFAELGKPSQPKVKKTGK